jgi:hypothetical protein
MKIFLILLSASYLILEIMFNLNVLNLSFNEKLVPYLNYNDSISSWSAYLSAFGLTILLFGTLASLIKRKIMLLILAPAFFYLVSSLQPYLLNIIVEQLNEETKEEIIQSYFISTGLKNEVETYKDLKIGSENQAFMAASPLIGSTIGLYEKGAANKTSLYNEIFYKDLYRNTEKYMEDQKRILSERQDAYKTYVYIEDKRKTGLKAYNNAVLHDRDELINSKYYTNDSGGFAGAVKHMKPYTKNNYAYFYDRYEGNVYNYFLAKLVCGGKNHCTEELVLNVIKKDNGKFGFKTYEVNKEVCTFSKNYKKGLDVKTFDLEIKTSKRVEKDHGLLGDDYARNYKYISCKLDVSGRSEIAKKAYIKRNLDTFGVENLNAYESYEDFFKSPDYYKAPMNLMLSKYDIKLPINWYSGDDKTLLKHAKIAYIENSKKWSYELMKEKLGYVVPYNYNNKQFYNYKKVKQEYYFKWGVLNVSTKSKFYNNRTPENFISAVGSDFKKYAGKDYRNKLVYYEDFRDAVVLEKSKTLYYTTISLFLILANLGFILGQTLTMSGKLKPAQKLIACVLPIILCLSAPLLLGNKYPSLNEQISESSVIPMAGTYHKWLLNGESLIYNGLNNIVLKDKEVNGMFEVRLPVLPAPHKFF